MKKILTLLIVTCWLGVFTAKAQISKSQVESGINTCNNLVAAHNWSEAFATLRSLDAAIGVGHPELHYLVSKQRYTLYSRINRPKETKDHLMAMENYARNSGSAPVIEDMLLSKAAYYAGTPISRQCYKDILYSRSKGKDDAGVEKCYKDIIAEAKRKNNHAMADVIQQMFTAWQDSIAGVRSASELKNLKAEYAAAQQDIDDKDTKITAQWATIVLLFVIVIALAAGLLFFLFTMFRNVRTIKKLRNSLDIANTSNDQKSLFIRNISAQIAPSLEQIAKGNSKEHIPALQQMLQHAEHYMSIESTREDKYPTEDVNVGKLCEEVAAATSGNIPVTVDGPKMNFPVNKEAVIELLEAIICEAQTYSGTERITISFKKRNPHTGNFLVTVIGMKIAEEDRDNLFTAFAKVYDLTVTDGLTLPTCSLMAYKMGGNLSVDTSFAKGTRFVLEVNV